MSNSVQGRFVWYQLNCHDLEAPQAFYQELLGWGIDASASSAQGDPYPMFTQGGKPLAGIFKMPPEAAGAPPHWLPYVGADDVDATYRQALDLAATSCVPPMDIPGAGRFAVLADPTGGFFAIYKPVPLPGPPAEPQLGDISWHELATSDVEAGFKFYQALFGWKIFQDMDMGPMGIYRLYGLDDRMLGGIYKNTPEMPGLGFTLYVSVKDVAASATKIAELGGKVMMGPHEVPGGDLILVFADPQGATFALHEKRSAGPNPV